VPRACVGIERDAGHVVLQARVVMGFHADAQFRGCRPDGVTDRGVYSRRSSCGLTTRNSST
jgi:hypothetical protein